MRFNALKKDDIVIAKIYGKYYKGIVKDVKPNLIFPIIVYFKERDEYKTFDFDGKNAENGNQVLFYQHEVSK